MIGTELQEFQKWLEYLDYQLVEDMMSPSNGNRTYAYNELENGHCYTFWAGGHSDMVTAEFDDDGNFKGFSAWD